MGSSTISQTDSLEVKRTLSAVAFLDLSFLRAAKFSVGIMEEFCLRIMLNINDWNIPINAHHQSTVHIHSIFPP
jgi:hypothetical protein